MPQTLLLTIRDMYVSMLPIVFGGVLNMIFVKTPVYKKHCAPIDRGQLWRDGKRIFGDNKTWIGFWSMVFFCMISQVFWGWVCNRSGWNNIHDLYRVRDNTLGLNILTGTLYGLATAVGYWIAIVILSFLREKMADNEIPRPFRGFPIVMVTSALMSIAFFGFAGIRF